MTANKQITADTPYSRESFNWLMENSASKDYLDEGILSSIKDAVANDDDIYLKSLYPIILNEYVRESAIENNLKTKEDELLNNFKSEVEAIDRKLKEERRLEMEKAERQDKAEAEKILNDL